MSDTIDWTTFPSGLQLRVIRMEELSADATEHVLEVVFEAKRPNGESCEITGQLVISD